MRLCPACGMEDRESGHFCRPVAPQRSMAVSVTAGLDAAADRVGRALTLAHDLRRAPSTPTAALDLDLMALARLILDEADRVARGAP